MQDLIERLQQHKYDYDQGELVLPGLMASDCKLAAEYIQQLKSSKHTQKRARSRLSAKNRTYRKEIQNLQNKLHKLKNELKQCKEENERLWGQVSDND